jgi:hypothetical protein
MPKRGHRILAAVLLTLAGGFGGMFYERYWKWRDCIHEAVSSCITPDGQNLIAGGMVWGFVAAILAAAAVRVVMRG